MNESTLFQGTVVFIIGSVDPKASKFYKTACIISYRNSSIRLQMCNSVELHNSFASNTHMSPIWFLFQVLDILKNGNASFSKFTMDGFTTHCLVGRNFDEAQVQEARELYEKPTVTEHWVLASAKLGKLVPVKPYDPMTNGKIFSNCIFTMSQIDLQDRLKLYAMITLHGGTVQKDLDNKVTHFMSGESQSVAMKVATLTKNKLTIITPDWVLECLRQKKLVSTDGFHPNLLITPNQQTSKITLMPAGVREEKSPSMMRNQIQQNIRPSRPTIQTMQHTPQQINEIIQSQIQQQQMQEKAKRAAAATSSHGSSNQTSQSPITTLGLGSNETPPQSQVISQMPTQKVTQQVLNTPVTIGTNQPNQPVTSQHVTSNQVQINSMTQNNQMNIQRQISLQQMEANARNQKIQMISQQLQQSTQNQQLLAQQQFKQYQNNQMIGNSSQAVSHIGQTQNNPQQPFPSTNQPTNIIQQQQQQQGQTPTVQHSQQFTGQQMKQIITPNQPTNQFMVNQTLPGKTIKTITPQASGNNSGSNYIQIIQQGQQIIQIQHPEGGQMQPKVLQVSLSHF